MRFNFGSLFNIKLNIQKEKKQQEKQHLFKDCKLVLIGGSSFFGFKEKKGKHFAQFTCCVSRKQKKTSQKPNKFGFWLVFWPQFAQNLFKSVSKNKKKLKYK